MSIRRSLLIAILLAAAPSVGRSAPSDFAGLVDIGGGRKMYLECRGSGSPTVVLVSGKGNGAALWNEVLDPADPVHDAPYDLVGAGQGTFRKSEAAVLPAVSRFTRVCAYDRPGTRIDGDDISTPVIQPHPVAQAVRDLRMLLVAAGETGPYVLVPHSYGGLVALLYARTYPDEIAGLVMVDAATERMKRVVSAEELAGWDASNRISAPEALEAIELRDAIEKIDAAPPLPERPAIVLSADKPWQLAAPDAQSGTAIGAMVTFADWLTAQDLLAASLDAKHTTKTSSGHHIYLYQPQLVVDAVRNVVDEVRGDKTSQVPRFEAAACPKLPVKALANARCGYLVVPEDRARPNGRTIRLIVAIIPALATPATPDPVVYLAGGPGGVALGESDLVVAAGFNRDRDLVVMNQRGTYLTEPALTCPSIDDFNRELLGIRLYSEATMKAHLAATESCRRSLETGAELSAYNSTESAADFADLRTVLGYAAWNVYGVSYGTFLAQMFMRDHAEGIRSVILDSTVPTTVTIPGFWQNTRAAFANLFKACAAETACAAAHPNLEQTFTGLVNKLEAEPLTVTVSDPATGEDIKVMIDGGALVDWLRNQTYSTPSLPAVPALIGGLADGRREAVEAIARDRALRAPPADPGAPSAGYGLGFGAVCREWYPFATPEDLVSAGREAFPDYPVSLQGEAVGTWAYVNEDCREIWKVPAAPMAVHRPVASGIPTLLISGTFDAVTALAWTKDAAVALSNDTIVSIPGMGHFVAPWSTCAQAVIASFLADPHAPDTSCVGGLTPPSFTARELP